jgi:hypothetical protein
MGAQPRASSWTDGLRRFLYGSGIPWLTPFIGTVDRADLEYLRECVLRDLAWVETLLTDDTSRTPALVQVMTDLAALVREPPGAAAANPRFRPIRYPWHVASGWTDYGAIRVALLASLPRHARPAAIGELKCMEPVVLEGSRATWHARVAELEALIAKDPDAVAIPSSLQALWREVDFGRSYRWIRIAKNTTILSLTWSLVLSATIVAAIALARFDVKSEVDPWFVALLGLLGGSISALRSTNLIELGERQPIDGEAVKLRLRPVVGAAMAIVVYVLGRSALAFELVTQVVPDHTAPVQIRVPDIAWGYYALAFLAGFAERWFLQVVDLAQARFNPAPATPPRPVPPPPPPPPPPGTSTITTTALQTTTTSTPDPAVIAPAAPATPATPTGATG